MVDQTSEATPKPEEENIEETKPEEEKGAVGAKTQAPLKKEEESPEEETVEETGAEEKKPEEKVPVSVQERINRMYARLQREREKNAAIKKTEIHPIKETAVEEEAVEHPEVEETPKPGLTEADVQGILTKREQERAMVASETRVLERHPDALLEDGSFNTEDPFVKKYIEIGKKNPALTLMVNGPELAEAMAEKELGIPYKKGRVDEANHANAGKNAHIATSTIAPAPATKVTALTAEQKHVAGRMGISEKQYAAGTGTTKIPQRKWDK